MRPEDSDDLRETGKDPKWAPPVPRRRKNAAAPPTMLSIFAQNTVPVTILCAPAGLGKTEALIEVFYQSQAAGLETAWIDGQHPMQDGATFGEELGDDRMPVGRRALFVDDADKFDPHTISRHVHSAITSGGKLFLAARKVEGMRLGRHLAAGNAQFLPPELLLWRRGVLTGLTDEKLAAGQVALIERLTEGWAAPAMLLAQHLAQGGSYGDDGVGLIESHVAGFIDEEVLAPFSRRWRRSLVALSLADEFDGQLLDNLAPDSGLTIEALRHLLGPLMVPIDSAQGWRFNHLLREHLRFEFARLSKSARHALRGIVTSWAASRGDVVAAATMLVQEGGEEKFLELVTDAGGVTLWLAKGHHHVRELVKIADDAGIDGDARFQLLRCAALLKEGRVSEAHAFYDRAMLSLPSTTEARRDAAFLQVTLLIYGCRDPAPEDANAFRFLESFALDEGWKTALPTIRAIHHSQRAEFAAAMGAIVEATNHGIAAGIDYNLLFLDMHRAAIFLAQGDLQAARKALLRSRSRWRRSYRHDHGAETVMSALFAQLEFEAGKSRNAAIHLRKSGSHVLESEAWLDIYVAGLEPMFRLAAEQHGVAAAMVAIDRTRDQLSARGLDRIANLLTRLRIALEGEEWLRTDRKPPRLIDATVTDVADEIATWQEREFATIAGAYRDLTIGETAQAVERLSHFISYALERNLKRSLLRVLLLRAAAFDRLGDSVAATADFEEALVVGEATGLRRAFAEFGGRHTAKQLAKRRGTGGFVRGLRRSNVRSEPVADRSLTKREQQMLQALSEGKSDKAIGRDHGITEHGVRFHLKNLYAKLGVHDRAAAVSKGTLLT